MYMYMYIAKCRICTSMYTCIYRYCPVREAKKPGFARLDQRTNVELKTQTKFLCEVGHAVCRKYFNHFIFFDGQFIRTQELT